MPRRPEGSREVTPSKRAMGDRPGPSFGPKTNVSVPISFGLPLIVIGLFLVVTAASTGRTPFWALGGAAMIAGALLFATGRRL
jgi:hypothetical protein